MTATADLSPLPGAHLVQSLPHTGGLSPLPEGTCPPVLMVVFNRADTARQVLQALARPGARPTRLYVAIDGPRPARPDEAAAVAAVQALFEGPLGWDCQVIRRYQTVNQGLEPHVSGALTWFFDQEPEGIILEDDTVPAPDFFPYAAALLERYRDDPRVGCIGGCNHGLDTGLADRYDYFFSDKVAIWGWAGWRRAWAQYVPTKARLAELTAPGGLLEAAYPDLHERALMRTRIEGILAGTVHSWAFIYQMACLAEGMRTALPTTNLVINIGFGEGGTNTLSARHPWANLSAGTLPGPDLRHPGYMARSGLWEEGRFPARQQLSRYVGLGTVLVWLRERVTEAITKRFKRSADV